MFLNLSYSNYSVLKFDYESLNDGQPFSFWATWNGMLFLILYVPVMLLH